MINLPTVVEAGSSTVEQEKSRTTVTAHGCPVSMAVTAQREGRCAPGRQRGAGQTGLVKGERERATGRRPSVQTCYTYPNWCRTAPSASRSVAVSPPSLFHTACFRPQKRSSGPSTPDPDHTLTLLPGNSVKVGNR